jgi:hypothetical protein
MKLLGIDVDVSNMATSLTPEPFSDTVVQNIQRLPYVADTSGLLVDFTSIENADMMIVSARQRGSFTGKGLHLVSGRFPKDAQERAAVLGTTAMRVLGKKIGETIQLGTTELAVVGSSMAPASWRTTQSFFRSRFIKSSPGNIERPMSST